MQAVMSNGALFVAAVVMLTLVALYFRALNRELRLRVQFLEDDNRWLRAELEALIPFGDQRRRDCERGDHVVNTIGDWECVYCGKNVKPHDVPVAVVHRGRR